MVAVLQVTRGYGADLVVNTLNHVLELCRHRTGAQMGARFANGLHFFATGNLVVSHQHFAEGAGIYHGPGGGYSALRYAFATGPADVAYTAWTDAMLGHPQRSLAVIRQAAEIINALDIPTRWPVAWCGAHLQP